MKSAPEILDAAKRAIISRASTRDDAEKRSMGRTVGVFNSLTGNDLSERDGWIFMLCVKLARSQQGEFHADDYVDSAGYIALASEAQQDEVRGVRKGSTDSP